MASPTRPDSIFTPSGVIVNPQPTSYASSSTNNTFFMPASTASPTGKARSKKSMAANSYKPTIITTVGARPACLVNASVTYVGEDQIYAFGGFDQYTDEVYNHVLRLDLKTKKWNLVDNYGDIPGVRMGRSSNRCWRDRLLTEHRPHSKLVERRQVTRLRRRKRASRIPFGYHHL
jgi:Kelch motif